MPTNSFVKVRDTNRKPLRGLWQRGGRYYLQVKERGSAAPRRIALEAKNLSEAKLAAEEKRREAREGDLPAGGRKPTFAELADACLAIAATKKKPRTVREDAHRLRRWKAAFGCVRVDLITTAMIAAARDKRIAAIVSIAAHSTTGSELVLEQQREAVRLRHESPAHVSDGSAVRGFERRDLAPVIPARRRK